MTKETTPKIILNMLSFLLTAVSINNTAANKIHILSIKNNPKSVRIENPNMGSIKINDTIKSAPK